MKTFSVPTAWLIAITAAAAWIAWLLQLPLRSNVWMVFVTGLPLLALVSRLSARSEAGAWGAFVRRTADLHLVALVLLFALAVQIQDAHGVTTDGVIYFTQLRSVVFDWDLDVAREFAYLNQPVRPVHVVPIGPVPVWLPLYLSVAAGDAVGRAIGWWAAPADPVAVGLTTPYVRAVLVSSFLIGAAGLVVLHVMLRREFGRGAAMAATILTLLATSLFWYLVYEPAMTHAVSFGFAAFFVASAAGLDPRQASNRRLAVTGLLLGLAFITRPQEAVFVLLPAFSVLALPVSIKERLAAALRYATWGSIGFAPLLLLQLAHFSVLSSRERLPLVGGGDAFLNLFDSRWSATLFSSWHGFFSWTPVAYIGFAGTLLYGRRHWPWACATVLVVLAMAWINGATPDLGGGWSFGGRRFVSCLTLLAPGLALIAQGLLARPMIAIGAVGAVAVAWNFVLMEQVRSGMLPADRPVSFARMTRGQADLYTRPPYFYPFAFPANALFSWRTGLPIDAYDLLGPERLQPSADIELGGSAGRFLLEGWGAPTGDETGSAWWIAGSPALLVLPLRLSSERVRVELRARTRLADPEVRVPVRVLVNGHLIGTFTPDTRQPSTASFETTRGDIWIHGFNRVGLVTPEPVWPVAIYRVRVTPIG